MNAFDNFMRSKYGKLVTGLLVLLAVVAIVIVILQGNTGNLSGTAGVPESPTYLIPKTETAVPTPRPVCTAGNNYTVENTTANPFNSVKFNFTSGTEVKEGAYDIFKFTLPADVVAAMESMQVAVKAATDARTYKLTCDFTSATGCGDLPVGDDAYSVSFDGSTDNGDGTYTLTFTVFVYGQHGLSHVAFSLPEGQTAGGLTDTYTVEACVVP